MVEIKNARREGLDIDRLREGEKESVGGVAPKLAPYEEGCKALDLKGANKRYIAAQPPESVREKWLGWVSLRNGHTRGIDIGWERCKMADD